MSTILCGDCGSEPVLERGDYQFTASGLDYVFLHNIELIRCPACGNVDPVLRRVNDLMQTILVGVVSKPERLAGQDIRFIRKQLGMSQEQFARLLHTDKTTISKWENNADPVGHQSDLLIRAVAVVLSQGPKEQSQEVVRKFPAIKAPAGAARHLDVDAVTLDYAYA